MRKREYYNEVARRSAYIARFAEIMRFRAKAHRWFTRSAIPWWLACLTLALSGCSTSLMGAAESDCERFTAPQHAAYQRCGYFSTKGSDFCDDVIYEDNSEEEINACIAWFSTADCKQVAEHEICDLHWTRNPIR